jgi:hypothetical protein
MPFHCLDDLRTARRAAPRVGSIVPIVVSANPSGLRLLSFSDQTRGSRRQPLAVQWRASNSLIWAPSWRRLAGVGGEGSPVEDPATALSYARSLPETAAAAAAAASPAACRAFNHAPRSCEACCLPQSTALSGSHSFLRHRFRQRSPFLGFLIRQSRRLWILVENRWPADGASSRGACRSRSLALR